MQLKISCQLPGPPPRGVNPGQIPAHRRQPLPQGNPGVIHRCIIRRLQQPGHRPTAQQPAVKPGAFLIGKNNHFQRMPQRPPPFRQSLRRFHRRHYPQRPVILAPVRHRIGMRPQGNGGPPGNRPLLAPDNIPGRVRPNRQPGIHHQPGHKLPPGYIRSRKSHPHHPPTLNFPNPPQSGQVAVKTGRVNGRKIRHS